jgi:type IV secretory pathway VirB3-like protein
MAIETHQVYPLFLALTRQPMTMGVTQNFFVINFMLCTILFLVSMNLVIAVGLFFILHSIGVICCRQDEAYFEITLGKLELPCPNRSLWGCNSYDPE